MVSLSAGSSLQPRLISIDVWPWALSYRCAAKASQRNSSVWVSWMLWIKTRTSRINWPSSSENHASSSLKASKHTSPRYRARCHACVCACMYVHVCVWPWVEEQIGVGGVGSAIKESAQLQWSWETSVQTHADLSPCAQLIWPGMNIHQFNVHV